ncbi:hypothetical protein V6N13_131010 [Hibiscus sabdariffa]|uniref:Uncharacterized protein n=2 Tax=Hibiscus sabdariffa TaxID=183260 RepID=A0ABR2D6L6_9ROSI
MISSVNQYKQPCSVALFHISTQHQLRVKATNARDLECYANSGLWRYFNQRQCSHEQENSIRQSERIQPGVKFFINKAHVHQNLRFLVFVVKLSPIFVDMDILKFSYKFEGNLNGPVPYPLLPGPESRSVQETPGCSVLALLSLQHRGSYHYPQHRHMVSNRPKDPVQAIGYQPHSVIRRGCARGCISEEASGFVLLISLFGR